MASKRLETAEKFIGQFETLDSAMLESVLAENHKHEFAPASLNPPGPFDKKGMIEHTGRLRNIMSGFPVTVKEIIDSESSKEVTIWASSRAHFRDEVKDDGVSEEEWAFKGEYVFMLFMDETGEKIVRTVEFLDSEATNRLRGLMHRAQANKEKGWQRGGNEW